MKKHWPFTLPCKNRLKTIAIFTPITTLAFALVYGLCNSQAAKASTHYPLFFDWELSIPLVPWMIYPYLSLNALFVLAAFVLKNSESIKGYCLSMIYSVFIAGIIFYFFPGRLGFVREVVPGYENLYQAMFDIDHPHNLFPSLHVTYSSLSMWAMMEQTKQKWFHGFLWLWLVTISASVVLVHQHHLFDIVSGLVLAILMYQYVYKKAVEEKIILTEV